MKVKDPLTMPALSDWNQWQMADKIVKLKEGLNFVAIQYDTGDNGKFNLDYISFHKK